MVDDGRPDPREDRVAETPTEHDSGTVDAPARSGGLAPGAEIGGRYRIVSRIGAGGMGELWRAYDLKLRVEVALKALRGDVLGSERHLEALRQEVRAAREVVSPNVCRIYQLEEIDGLELVSMEFVDGQTLLEVLKERGPLELNEAQDIASQFLAGLEAIHAAGFIHRDIKPENIMVTRAGRVVVMDFGLARHESDPSRSASGTPAYMAPEQVRGKRLDARADVYAAGVVLAEMVSPGGVKDLESRKSLWEGVRSEPPELPDSPWAPVIRKAVLKDREQRYHTAHTLTRALEEVTLRVAGAEDLTPYPGLASFTEADAEYFFGREAEIEAVWRRLQGAHLLALVGSSGAGKTSFLGAGLIPNAPNGWAIVRCTPGNAAVSSLARAMAREMAGDADALELVVGMDDPDVAAELFSRWRRRHHQALLIVDQFEELFTQNSDQEQRRFAALLGSLPVKSDVRVLLSMRDDFLMLCNRHDALRPVFSELTPLDPPVGAALRRALVQPATRCGYRFEDDELVEELLAEVAGERGALPLLAFAMARLWEKRDRENGLLTRTAFRDIGGVGGALARHAEETIDRIGLDRVPVVRELFRNLVTADGTRAVRQWNELLSVFDRGQRDTAEDVLRELIDARLLTSYEIREDEHQPTRRVEIIHESLLASWPRLVRWQMQDQEGAQIRDELRQAARSWDEHGRHEDRLWTGTAYREFRLWRERYPGGLTEVEEAFAHAMTSLAGRRRRRRRIAAAAALVVVASVAAVFAGLWRRSVLQEHRAEAANLVSLGQLELDSYPSATVAYAIASLELADSPAARRLALEALWKGPTAMIVDDRGSFRVEFSPDGQHLVHWIQGVSNHLQVFDRGGSSALFEKVHEGEAGFLSPISKNGHFMSVGSGPDATLRHVLWSIPEMRHLADTTHDRSVSALGIAGDGDRSRHVVLVADDDDAIVEALGHDGTVERVGTVALQQPAIAERTSKAQLDETGRWLALVVGNEVLVREIGDHELSESRLLGQVQGAVADLAIDPLDRFLATAEEDGTISLWDLDGKTSPVVLQGPPNVQSIRFTEDGTLFQVFTVEDDVLRSRIWSNLDDEPRFVRATEGPNGPYVSLAWAWDGSRSAQGGPDEAVRVWPLAAAADADPRVLRRGNVGYQRDLSFERGGAWLATADASGVSLWPLAQPFPSVISRHESPVSSVAFGPQGTWLASGSTDGSVWLWPLEGEVPAAGRVIFQGRSDVRGLAVSPDGSRLLVGSYRPAVVVPLDGNLPTTLPGLRLSPGVAFSSDGRFALGAGQDGVANATLVLWDVGTGADSVRIEPEKDLVYANPHQLSDGRILSSGKSGLWVSDPATQLSELLFDGGIVADFAVSHDERRVALVVFEEWGFGASGRPIILDLDTREVYSIETHGDRVYGVDLDPTGTMVVTGDVDGVVRVGPVTGEQPHLLIGHEGRIWSVAVDPAGRWIASGGQDGTVRLWPLPDLSKPPLHTLPREELIAKLKTLTNLRVVRDSDSSTGWKLTHDPFPGWETVPTW